MNVIKLDQGEGQINYIGLSTDEKPALGPKQYFLEMDTGKHFGQAGEIATGAGADGASAFQVAVANGFQGTEAEWLASLIGPAGGPGTTTWAGITDKPTLGTASALDATAFDAAGSAAAAQAASLPVNGKAATAGAADTAAALSAGADRTKLDAITGTNTGDQTDISGSSGSCTGNALTATTLQTPRNINGTAFDGSADIAAVPTWKCGQTTYSLATASGVQNIAHGLGRVPKFVRITAQLVFSAAVSMECVGRYDGASQSGQCVIWAEGTSTATTDNIYQSTASALGLSNAGAVNPFTGATKQSGVITVNATNIVITWTKSGSPTGTANLAWECT